jgi:DNA-binding phage protein
MDIMDEKVTRISSKEFVAQLMSNPALTSAERDELNDYARDLELTARLNQTLLEARRAKNLTQAQLAELVGMNQAEISRLEGPNANPRLSTLLKVTQALGLEFKVVFSDNTYVLSSPD